MVIWNVVKEAPEDVEVDNPDADLSDCVARNSAVMLPGLFK